MISNIYTVLFCLLLLPILSSSQNNILNIEKSLSSVVTVAVYKSAPIGKKILGTRGNISNEAYLKSLDLTGAEGSGSGFIISHNKKKYIITNAHVVESASDEPESIFVFSISRKKYETKIVGGDNFYDIAVLEFLDEPGTDITSISFTNEEVKIGEPVFAIGNPLGEFPYTVTDGIISAKNRVRGGTTGKFGYLQTSATMIWGNSGGPLINLKGEVVGINSQIHFATSPSGEQIIQSQLNFALEATISKRLILDIIENKGVIKRSYFGLEFSENYEIASRQSPGNNLKKISDNPILSGIMSDSPNNHLNDMINTKVVKVNNENIYNMEDLLGEFEKSVPKTPISISLKDDSGKVSVVSINSNELKTDHLKNIAAKVLKENTDLIVDNESQQVSVSYTNNQKGKYKYSQGKKGFDFSTNQNYVKSTGFIIAAGLYNENNPNLWRITTLADLGAALRIMGLNGVFDYYIAADDGQPILFRQYFSGNHDIFSKKLWY